MNSREYAYVPTVQQKMNIIGMYRNANKSVKDMPTDLHVAHVEFLEAFARLATACANDLRRSNFVSIHRETNPSNQ